MAAEEPPPVERLARHFENFAERHLRATPLYARLSRGIAGEPELLSLAAYGRAEPLPLLFLSAVQYLLFGAPGDPLADYYPNLTNKAAGDGDPFPAFLDFCRRHQAALRELLATRRVQTNEVRRCTSLLPAFVLAASWAGGSPLALVEIGASAGLNLLWDRYRYDYGPGRACGDPDSPIALACALHGDRLPTLPAAFPPVAVRVGIDLHPVDVRDPDDGRWLRALIWPEQAERADLLERALRLARRDPPTLRAGDTLDLLPDVLSGLPTGAVPCVFHSYTLNQFPPDARERFSLLMAHLARGRRLCHISLEWLNTEHPQLEWVTYPAGTETRTLLARCDAHGRWLEWLA